VEDEAGTPTTIFNNGPKTDLTSDDNYSPLEVIEQRKSKMEDKYMK